MFQNWIGERVSCGRCDIGASELDAGHAFDENGVLRLVFSTPTWEDYLTLAFEGGCR
jgi:hypothetical protein